MKLRRAAALFLSIALLFCLSAPTADAYSAPGVYSDVPTSHWAHDAIARWSEYGVINGYNGKFNPSGYLTRGEMAVILNNLLLYTGRAPNIFFDLDDSWYTDAILKCYAAGVMVGSGGYLRPAHAFRLLRRRKRLRDRPDVLHRRDHRHAGQLHPPGQAGLQGAGQCGNRKRFILTAQNSP